MDSYETVGSPLYTPVGRHSDRDRNIDPVKSTGDQPNVTRTISRSLRLLSGLVWSAFRPNNRSRVRGPIAIGQICHRNLPGISQKSKRCQLSTNESAKRLLAVLALLALTHARASANTESLSGKMAWWARAVGSWVCQVSIEPTQGQAAQKGFVIAIGSLAPRNVFHWHVLAPGVEADQYDGYSVSEKAWWETQADSSGYAEVLRSTDGAQFDQISSPSAIVGDRDVYREIYSSATTVHLRRLPRYGPAIRGVCIAILPAPGRASPDLGVLGHPGKSFQNIAE